jgi:hypothetical protein
VTRPGFRPRTRAGTDERDLSAQIEPRATALEPLATPRQALLVLAQNSAGQSLAPWAAELRERFHLR